jgi:hypothetical protein
MSVVQSPSVHSPQVHCCGASPACSTVLPGNTQGENTRLQGNNQLTLAQMYRSRYKSPRSQRLARLRISQWNFLHSHGTPQCCNENKCLLCARPIKGLRVNQWQLLFSGKLSTTDMANAIYATGGQDQRWGAESWFLHVVKTFIFLYWCEVHTT